jgi:hypothetical protein
MEDRFKYKILDIKSNKFINSNKGTFLLKPNGLFEKIYRGLQFNLHDVQNLKPIFCIGLKDKNDKLIYEGDILQEDTCIGKVVSNDGCYEIEYISMDGYELVCNLELKNVKIIGNIYENPELLKGD